jgi:nitroreductase
MPSNFSPHTLPGRVWRGLLHRADLLLVRLGARNRFWAAVYYVLLHPDFAREQMSCLAGRAAYEESLRNPRGSMALLRRNVHRIEKGLLMRPRRAPFALDYIAETVTGYDIASKAAVDQLELAWARDVLNEYFDANGSHGRLAALYQQFKKTAELCSATFPPRIPYRRNLSQPLGIDYEALLELAKHRRSVRWFRQIAVPRAAIDRAIELGCFAPSACNRQPFSFRIFDDPGLVRQIVKIPFGLAGYDHNVPVIVVIVGKQGNIFAERDRHLIYIDGSLAVMGFLFGLEVQGISSCCVNWPDIEQNERDMGGLLGLAPDEHPILLVALGYPDPDGLVANSTKKSLSQLRRYNSE